MDRNELRLMTPGEASKVLNLTTAGVRALEGKRLEPIRTVGGRRVYFEADVMAEVERRKKASEK